MSDVKETAVKVAQYWAGFLKDTSTSKFDNGDKSDTGAMVRMLSELGKPQRYPEKEIQAFESQLLADLMSHQPRYIGVDYSPDVFLSDIADKCLSGWSPMSTFPCKTNMYIEWDAGIIWVSQGYGADRVQL